MAAITTIPSEMLKKTVVLVLAFPTLHTLHTWNYLTAHSKHLVIFTFVSLHCGYQNIKHQTYSVDILY